MVSNSEKKKISRIQTYIKATGLLIFWTTPDNTNQLIKQAVVIFFGFLMRVSSPVYQLHTDEHKTR